MLSLSGISVAPPCRSLCHTNATSGQQPTPINDDNPARPIPASATQCHQPAKRPGGPNETNEEGNRHKEDELNEDHQPDTEDTQQDKDGNQENNDSNQQEEDGNQDNDQDDDQDNIQHDNQHVDQHDNQPINTRRATCSHIKRADTSTKCADASNKHADASTSQHQAY